MQDERIHAIGGCYNAAYEGFCNVENCNAEDFSTIPPG